MAGRLYVVGLGPGNEGYLTADARSALEESNLIVGYSVYISLLGEEFADKEVYSTGMGDEVERCRYAWERASGGDTVSVICSGDPGVYGMASLVYSLSRQPDIGDGDSPDMASYAEADSEATASNGCGTLGEVDIIIIPGITAALSGAAMLGAPICNDFAVISLSTALTPWERIEKRLEAAAEGDFAIVLYNPMSRNRPDTLRKACDVIIPHIGAERIAGYVRNIGREGCRWEILTVGEMREMELDMFTTIFIGNSTTENINGKMVTGREYRL